VWQACLLVVDDTLLKVIAMEALGDRQQEGKSLGLAAWLLSFWLSGNLPWPLGPFVVHQEP